MKDKYLILYNFIGITTVVLTTILFFGFHFSTPLFIDSVSLKQNPNYYFQNGLFHLLAILIAIFGVMGIWEVICKNKIKLSYFSKVLIYIFINILYPILALFIQKAYETDVSKYNYSAESDSLMIAYIGMHLLLCFGALIYYPFINLLAYITFNTKCSHILWEYIYRFLIVLIILFMPCCLTSQFIWEYVFIYFILFAYVLYFYKSISYVKLKRLKNKN